MSFYFLPFVRKRRRWDWKRWSNLPVIRLYWVSRFLVAKPLNMDILMGFMWDLAEG